MNMQLQDQSIILYVGSVTLNGCLFDSLEYYLMSSSLNSNVFLVFVTKDNETKVKQLIQNVVKERYTVDVNLLNIVVLKTYLDLLRYRFNVIVSFIVTTCYKVKQYGLPLCKKLYIISENTSKSFVKNDRILYYSEMPFCYADKHYYVKSFFDAYKPLNKMDDKWYVTYPKGNVYEVKDIIFSYCKNNFIVKEQLSDINIHTKFNKFLYIKSKYWFDPHPRLFLECEYYKKEYYYENRTYIKDGSYYRYHEIKRCGLKNHILTTNDPIIKVLCNE